jgi:spore coat polysaccharide biosynthesis protein SpsF (cytidylyltransferase family)
LKIIGIIEARMGSSRLPGKTLMPVFKEKALLELVVERFMRCCKVDEIWVATTTETADDAIMQWCADHNIRCFRGSEEDVLDRVAQTAIQADADGIVQMGADSAYLDYRLIDELVLHFRSGRYDYVCNDMVLTYPLGIYGHVVKTECLRTINAKSDLEPADRENVVRYVWERPSEYSILNVTAPSELSFPGMRLTIDYPEDLTLARRVYRHFNHTAFSTKQIIGLCHSAPEMFRATKGLVQEQAPFFSRVEGYRNVAGCTDPILP